MSIPNSVFCNCLFFPIIDSCSHFARYFYTTRKDRAVHTILLAREERHPSCATIPSFLFKVASYCAAIIRPCAVFIIWSQSLSHLAGKEEEKKKTASFVESSFSPFLHREVYGMVQQWQLLLWLHFCWPNSWFSLPPKPNKKDRENLEEIERWL